VKEEEIGNIFKKEGIKLNNILLLKDNDGASKGVAFAMLSSPEDANRACKLNGIRFGGRSLRINMASQKPNERR